jgi:hypothetical protein
LYFRHPRAGTLLSGREFASLFFAPFAIQFWFQKAQKDLGYPASTLHVGRVATEKNQSSPKRRIKLPTFFVPDSSVLGTRIHEFACKSHSLAP